jgi:hypothetical protein
LRSRSSNKRRRFISGLCGVALALAGRAFANDSASELAAGGIVLVKNDVIAMQREDLVLSPSEVRVRYEMGNDSGKPVTLRVAFPMPEMPAWSPGGFHTATSPRGIMLPQRVLSEPNFMGFRVWADGRELTPEVEIRATLPDGRDIAAAVQAIGGLPLVLRSGLFALPDDPELDVATRRRLSELGAIEELPDRAYQLLWTTRITFHWMQTFAPGVTVVEHSYRPILGFGYVGFAGQGGALFAGPDSDAASVFCVDAAGQQTLRSLGQQARAKRLAKGEPEFSELFGYTLGYVLQTAKNWRGPIGTFHLTVKGDPIPPAPWSGGGPTLAMYFCSPVPLTSGTPLVREGEARDFVPMSDLRVLFVRE